MHLMPSQAQTRNPHQHMHLQDDRCARSDLLAVHLQLMARNVQGNPHTSILLAILQLLLLLLLLQAC